MPIAEAALGTNDAFSWDILLVDAWGLHRVDIFRQKMPPACDVPFTAPGLLRAALIFVISCVDARTCHA